MAQYRFTATLQIPMSPLTFAKGSVVDQEKIPGQHFKGWLETGMIELAQVTPSPVTSAQVQAEATKLAADVAALTPKQTAAVPPAPPAK